jgi:hypothetical protein
VKDPTLYVPSHAGIWNNRKFLRLTRRLATSDLVVFACLHALWQGVLTQRPEGVLIGWDELDVALAARWPGEPAVFLAALEAEGWLLRDAAGDLVVHEWEQYGGAGATLRAGASKRKRDQRDRDDAARLGITVEELRARRDKTGVSRPVTVTSQGQAVTSGSGHADVTPDRNGSGSGSGSGTDRDRERGSAAAEPPAPPSPPPEEPKAPEPEPKPLRSGAVPVGVLVSARRHLLGGREGFEESFANWARDPEDLIERHGERWRREYPQLDGKPPRPRLDNVVKAKWGAFKRARERDGEATAVEAVGTWLSELAAKHAWGFERDGSAHSTVVDDPVRRRALREWDRLRQSGGDVGAFDPWFAKNRERFERGEPPPTAKPDDDVMDPAEVAKILAGAVKRPVSSGRVIRGERAPAAGGTEVSGATTETAGVT